MIKTSIIIPAYHEEGGISVVLEKVLKVIDDSYEVIVVDDGSNDKTAEIASRFDCRVVKHEVNKGKGMAIRTGIAEAKGARVIWIDADDSYPPDIIPLMGQALDKFQIVVCSRKYGKKYIPFINRIGIAIFRASTRGIYGFQGYDPCSGLYGGWKNMLEEMDLTSKRFTIEPEISLKAGRMKLKTLDIPIEYRTRIGISKLGTFKVGLEDSWCIAKHLFWRLRE